MKKLLIIAVAFQASFSMASYTNFLGQGGDPTVGGHSWAPNWPTDPLLPHGSVTGLIVQADNVWIDIMQNFACRLEGGRLYTPDLVTDDFSLRGGTAGSGITSILEIDTTDWASGTTNLAMGQLTFWSQHGEAMQLSILNGRVEANTLNLVDWGQVGVINMGSGVFHANTKLPGSLGTVNMLSGGTGAITWDVIKGGMGVEKVNFASDNLGSFTIGANFDDTGGTNVTSGGLWEWMIANGKVYIDDVVNTNASSYIITYDSWAGKLRLPGALTPEENYTAWVEGFGLVATNESGSTTNDFDLDGLENLTEYALGGNPVIPDADSINPTISGAAGVLEYVYNRRVDTTFRGLIYGLTVTTDDLSLDNWTPIGTALETGFGPVDAFFESVTNAIPSDTPIGFINLEVTPTF